MLQTETNKQKKATNITIKTIMSVFISALLTGLITVIPTLAYKSPDAMALEVINSIGSILQTIFPALCVLVFAFCLIRIVMGSNPKSTESAVAWGTKAIWGFMGFNCLGLILDYGTKLFAGQNYHFG